MKGGDHMKKKLAFLLLCIAFFTSLQGAAIHVNCGGGYLEACIRSTQPCGHPMGDCVMDLSSSACN